MKYRKFGNTNLEVSVLGFGAASVGSRTNRSRSVKALNEAFDLGVNFYDTAPFYAQGESEKIIGDTFKDKRDKVIIATKVGLYPTTKLKLMSKFKPIVRSFLQILPYERRSSIQKSVQTLIRSDNGSRVEFSPNSIVKSVESSLKRLQSDYIDILLLHVTPQSYEIDRVTEELQLLQSQGKIRHFGASPHSIEETLMWLQLPDRGLSTLQVRLNMLEVKTIDNCLPLASNKGIAIIAREPFAQGKFLPNVNNKSEIGFIGHQCDRRFDFLANDDIRTLSQAALQFLFQVEGVSVVLSGMSNANHIRENVAAIDKPPLTRQEIMSIRTLNLLDGR